MLSGPGPRARAGGTWRSTSRVRSGGPSWCRAVIPLTARRRTRESSDPEKFVLAGHSGTPLRWSMTPPQLLLTGYSLPRSSCAEPSGPTTCRVGAVAIAYWTVNPLGRTSMVVTMIRPIPTGSRSARTGITARISSAAPVSRGGPSGPAVQPRQGGARLERALGAGRAAVRTTTPTGHAYVSSRPPLLGCRPPAAPPRGRPTTCRHPGRHSHPSPPTAGDPGRLHREPAGTDRLTG